MNHPRSIATVLIKSICEYCVNTTSGGRIGRDSFLADSSP